MTSSQPGCHTLNMRLTFRLKFQFELQLHYNSSTLRKSCRKEDANQMGFAIIIF